jgi:hypothetical protein
MLRVAQPRIGQRPPLTGGGGNGSRRPRGPYAWEARTLLAAAGGLYYAAAAFTPFGGIDAWIDERFFWEPIAAATIGLLLVLAIAGRRERRRLERQLKPGSAAPPSELVPICIRCKAVHDQDDHWEPIEAYLAYRTPDKFSRSLCPACLERLAS